MNRSTLHRLVCPYCRGKFRVVTAVEGRGDRLSWGLIECRCFTFPIVHGILLLSLAKGYGGAEEELQPFVPFQVAAIEYLKRRDVAGFRGWVKRHVPLLYQLIFAPKLTYLDFARALERELSRESASYLRSMQRFEVVGASEPTPRAPRSIEELATAVWYVGRAISLRATVLGVLVRRMPLEGRVLSLCCGHGVFELYAGKIPDEIVSIDGQLINAFVTQRFANQSGDYICHDIQLGIPFGDRAFDTVFSSTCLPEVPAAATVVSESIRVTSQRGRSVFHDMWTSAPRISRTRSYRFCQNLFADFEAYWDFFRELAHGRKLAHFTYEPARLAPLNGPLWSKPREIRRLLRARPDICVSFNVGSSRLVPLRPVDKLLYLSPLYALVARTRARLSAELRGKHILARRDFFPDAMPTMPATVEIERARARRDPAYREHLLRKGVLVQLPRAFGDVVAI